jgi:8-oxo-dGTP pyrophosphatase MutT (NUDIX family)
MEHTEIYTPTIDDIRSFFSSFRRNEITNHALKRAGVLLPLLTREGELSVLFTQRTEQVAHHKGQVSFPGGTMDENDASVLETALRETEEEIGLQRNVVEVLGVLDDFCTPSGFCITPVVGFLPRIPTFILNRTEVSSVFDIPVYFFLNPRNERAEKQRRAGLIADVYFYHYDKYEIWGATANILRTFLHALAADIKHKKAL